MTDIAKHVRIFIAQPDDEFVKKRKASIKEIETAFKKINGINDLIKLGNDLAKALENPLQLGQSFAETTIKALKKQSDSFVDEGEEVQIVVTAVLAALQYLEGHKSSVSLSLTTADVFAVSLWSALSFQGNNGEPKIDALRDEVVTVCKEIVDFHAHSSRRRLPVPAVGAIEGEDFTAIAASVKSALTGVITPLTTNAALDREEIDILWWVFNDWSTIVGNAISSLNPVQAGIISGLEISNIQRRLPSHSHYQLAVRGIENSEQMYTCNEVIAQLGEYLPKVVEHLQRNSIITTCPSSFPLFNLLITEMTNSDSHALQRPLSEWIGRTLLEGTIVNLASFLNDGR